jgi:hypothetical protein
LLPWGSFVVAGKSDQIFEGDFSAIGPPSIRQYRVLKNASHEKVRNAKATIDFQFQETHIPGLAQGGPKRGKLGRRLKTRMASEEDRNDGTYALKDRLEVWIEQVCVKFFLFLRGF